MVKVRAEAVVNRRLIKGDKDVKKNFIIRDSFLKLDLRKIYF